MSIHMGCFTAGPHEGLCTGVARIPMPASHSFLLGHVAARTQRLCPNVIEMHGMLAQGVAGCSLTNISVVCQKHLFLLCIAYYSHC